MMTEILLLLIIVCAYAALTVHADKQQLARCDDLLSGVFPMTCSQYSSFGAVTEWSQQDDACAYPAVPAMDDAAPASMTCNDGAALDADSAAHATDNIYVKPADF